MTTLFHEIAFERALTSPDADALKYQGTAVTYAELAARIRAAAAGLRALGAARRDRVAIYMEKRLETVQAMFGATAAGAAFVPINPLLKPEQVAYILNDCSVRILVTTADRLPLLTSLLHDCAGLHVVVVVGPLDVTPHIPGIELVEWEAALSSTDIASLPCHIDIDMAAILYTSGSTGKPKGVVLSHRNLTTGAESVAHYLQNSPRDRILCALPLSFDYGLSQVSTAFHAGACAVLMNYLLPRDIIKHVAGERITGLAAVPPLWIQLAQMDWSAGTDEHLRYITNSGGAMPRATLALLRSKLPKTRPFLMYGLTEAFRSTYLPPEQLDRRPDSIGKAIPNAEVMVVRDDGSPCAPNEPGELVHRGALVALGYWNDTQKTAERFRPVPGQTPELPLTEMAVWSGDTVRSDEEGYLYFISRRDEMIKTSGYRVSPTEVEEVIYATQLVAEAAAIGPPHPVLGQAIVIVVALPPQGTLDVEALLAECRRRLPAFMVPALVKVYDGSLPRNPNGKIDRRHLAGEFSEIFMTGRI